MYHHVPTMLTFGFTEAHIMTYMLPNQSTSYWNIFVENFELIQSSNHPVYLNEYCNNFL